MVEQNLWSWFLDMSLPSLQVASLLNKVAFPFQSGECDFLCSVSSQQRFEAVDVKAFGASQLLDSLCYGSLTDQFYLENKGKYILKAWGHAHPKDVKRRERQRERERERDPGPLALPFICFFLPLGLPYVNWASWASYLRSSLWSLDFPLFYFHGLFLSLSFSHHCSGLLFPILTTYHHQHMSLKYWLSCSSSRARVH